MRIVIDIDSETYTKARIGLLGSLGDIIANGTPLPDNHGDLIDRDILLQNWKVIPSRDRLIFDRYIQTLNGVIPAEIGE